MYAIYINILYYIKYIYKYAYIYIYHYIILFVGPKPFTTPLLGAPTNSGCFRRHREPPRLASDSGARAANACHAAGPARGGALELQPAKPCGTNWPQTKNDGTTKMFAPQKVSVFFLGLLWCWSIKKKNNWSTLKKMFPQFQWSKNRLV